MFFLIDIQYDVISRISYDIKKSDIVSLFLGYNQLDYSAFSSAGASAAAFLVAFFAFGFSSAAMEALRSANTLKSPRSISHSPFVT